MNIKYFSTILFVCICLAFLGQKQVLAQCTLNDPDGSPPGILECPGSSEMAYCLNEGANWCFNAKHIYVPTTSGNSGPPPAPPLANPCAISLIMGYENQGLLDPLTAQQAIWIVQGEPPSNYPPEANTLATAAIAGCASGLTLSNSSYQCGGGSGSGTLIFSVDVNTSLPYVHIQFFEMITCLNGTGSVNISVNGATYDPSSNWITNTGSSFTVFITLTSSSGASCFVDAYENGGLLSFGYPDLGDYVQYWWDDDTSDPDQPFCQYLGTWTGGMTYYSTFPNTDPLDPCPLCVTDVISSCNDNGTPTDPSDDYIEFELVLIGLTTPGNESTTVGGTTNVPIQTLDLPPASMPTFITTAVPGGGDITTQIQYTSDASPFYTCSTPFDIPDPGPCSVAACTSSVTANPGSCQPSTNTYDVTGQVTFSNPPTTGTMTVADGSTTQVFNAPFTSPQAYTLSGITADGATHTVTVTFSADSGCGSSTTYTAPTDCTPASCTSSVTANPGSCQSSTNTYSVSGQVTFSNPPATGTMTVADGSTTQVFNAPFTSPQAYTLSGITADGATHTVTVTFSADSGCGSSTTYTAPAACTPASCTSSVTATPSPCDPSDNNYSVSGQVTFSNPPSTGTMTVADGTTTQVFNAPFTSPQAYTLSGITADGATHTVTVTFSADSGCGSSTTYTAPEPCTPASCSSSVTATPGLCQSSTNTYSVSGQVTFSNPPATGTMTVADGTTTQVFNAPFTSPQAYTLSGITADGATHTVTVTFSADSGCGSSQQYTAPDPCSTPPPCSITSAGESNIQCNDNGTGSDETDDYLTLDLNPVASNTSGTYIVSVSVGSISPTFGSFGSTTSFTITADLTPNQDIVITLTDKDDPACRFELTITDPAPCSTPPPCSITSAGQSNIQCNDNGTGSDETDDYLTLDLNPVGSNTSGTYNVSVDIGSISPASGSFGSTTGFTITADLTPNEDITITITDSADPTCQFNLTITDPAPCSTPPPCSITSAGQSNIQCNDNGTGSDETDDYLTLDLNPVGSNTSGTYNVSVDVGSIFPTSASFGSSTSFTITADLTPNEDITITITDSADPTCQFNLTIKDPAPCSNACIITILDSTAGACNDNGTNTDPSDDTFDVTVNATATNGGASNQFNVTDGTTTWGPFDYGTGGTVTGLPADGSTITLTFNDVDDSSCSSTVDVSQNSCSSTCVLTITNSTAGACNDNGTSSDPSDDTFDVTVNATAVNGGASGQFNVTDGTTTWGPFDYGTGGTVTGLPADGSTITLTFTDLDDASCSNTADVSQTSCSNTCVLTITDSTAGVCNDNGTNSDPSDDTFDVTVNATAVNGGASGQFNVTDGTTTWGPFDYGTGGTVTGLPADGSTITLTFTDLDDASCSNTADVSQTSCSNTCVLTITDSTAGVCNDNGTNSDPSDDTFDVTVNANAVNGGASGQFNVTDGTTTWGPFDYGTGGTVTGLPADGSTITLTFTDVDDNTCSATADVFQFPCSSACVITITDSTVGPCDDGGTNSDPSDDTFDVTVNASAVNGGASGQFNVTDGTTTWGPFDYGTGGTVTSLPADGSTITLTFVDADDSACNATADVSQNSCSNTCVLTPTATTGPCDDGGTNSDPSDDTFDVTVNASAVNGGASGQFNVTDGTTTWGPFDYGTGGTVTSLPADGSTITLTFVDADDSACNATVDVSQNSCSNTCVLTPTATAGPCDDGGTNSDPSDDTFDVTVNATATNGGASNQFNVTDGTTTWGPFDYGTGGTVTGLPADGSTITLTFTDVDDNTCSATADVFQFPCSSACVITITDSTVGPCDDGGTNSDPSDDTFDVTVNATAVNGGASGQFNVTDGTTTWGPFDYGTGGTVTGLPADGSTITLTFTDVDDNGCVATVDVSQTSCSVPSCPPIKCIPITIIKVD